MNDRSRLPDCHVRDTRSHSWTRHSPARTRSWWNHDGRTRPRIVKARHSVFYETPLTLTVTVASDAVAHIHQDLADARCAARQVVGCEIVHSERVRVGEEGQEVVDPAQHVGLAHAELDLLVGGCGGQFAMLCTDVSAAATPAAAAAHRCVLRPWRDTRSAEGQGRLTTRCDAMLW
ncbi:hypothetical protein SSAG_00608 [Streptomyces sp. Mg1]|nr:hypothetical protein M444_03395 [Streptomyces sp. Mg1]EDX20817.1 hypothetical protein SSAG_00608 [Streptomyces sp. Mg1]